jgi:hypothetical protein
MLRANGLPRRDSGQKGTTFVPPKGFILPRLLPALAAVMALWGVTAPVPAAAQAKLDARYTASLAGVTVGRGSWVIDLRDDQYTAAASGAASGLLKMFAGGTGTSASRGYLANGQPVPRNYAATLNISKKKDQVEIAIENGAVTKFEVKPDQQPDSDRIPITEAHRKNVTDPMSASLMRVSGNGDLMTKDACQRTLAIFDGRLRYDLKLAFKRMDKVKAEKGYQGTAVVCSVRFQPVAGYIPDRPTIKYLVGQQDMEVWLAPITGSRIVVPFRILVPTPVGDAVVEATQFMVGPRTTQTGAKSL